MENYEIQHFLDILLPCSDKQKRSKTANSKLDAKQEGKLYSIARRLCFESSLLRKNSGRFLVALKDIIRILNSIKYNQNMTKLSVRILMGILYMITQGKILRQLLVGIQICHSL